MNANGIGFTEQFCIEVSPVPSVLVIFGASGDLAKRKLIPALYRLFERELLHPKSRIVGFARTEMDTQAFRALMTDALKEFVPEAADLSAFMERLTYCQGKYDELSAYNDLRTHIETLENETQTIGNRLLYLSVPATLYETIAIHAAESGITREQGKAWRNVLIEKPFGHDAESAKKLEDALSLSLREKQIYRIDHYIGKETVQNLMMLRFANQMFEPLWNAQHIDHVQITVSETLGVGSRAGYYETAGLVRDMFQNHLFQMMATVAMEPPGRFEAKSIREERAKLLRCIRPWKPDEIADCWVRGQYDAGVIDGKDVPAYRNEKGIAPDSQIDTFAACKVMIDNFRWAGVPFYLRSGKRLNKKLAKITIVFKHIPHSIFQPLAPKDLAPNILEINVQPEEGITLTLQTKQPGPKMCMGTLKMSYRYSDVYDAPAPEAYERLLLDAMLGDQTLFISRDCIMDSWKILDPILEYWNTPEGAAAVPLQSYASGSKGPEAAYELLRKDGREWLDHEGCK